MSERKIILTTALAAFVLGLSSCPASADDHSEVSHREYIATFVERGLVWLCGADFDIDGDGDIDALYSISSMHPHDYTEEKYRYLKWMVFFKENDKSYFSQRNSIFTLATRGLEIARTSKTGSSPVFISHGYYPDIKNRVWGVWFEKMKYSEEVIRSEDIFDTLDILSEREKGLSGGGVGGGRIEDVLPGYRCLDEDEMKKIYREESAEPVPVDVVEAARKADLSPASSQSADGHEDKGKSESRTGKGDAVQGRSNRDSVKVFWIGCLVLGVFVLAAAILYRRRKD